MRFPLHLLLALLGGPAAASAQTPTLTFTHANVVNGATGAIEADRTVVILGSRISQVLPGTRPVPAGGRVVDARGQYLLPGLWDMHTQVYFDGTARAGTDLILPLLLANGITGIRDMGSQLDSILRARTEVAAHRWLGPRLVVSGPMLDGPKSPYQAAIAVASPEAGRRAVQLLKARGVDFIKVQSYVPRDAYFAIADEAKKLGLLLEGHVPDGVRAREAIAAGQRTFEHLIGIFEASSPDETAYVSGSIKSPGRFLATYDPRREAAIVRQLAAAHVWQCPTLYWERGQWLVDAVDWRADSVGLAYAGRSWVAQRWPRSQKGIAETMDYEPLATREKFVAHELALVGRLHAAGVEFLAGTDAPAGVDLLPGRSLHQELQRFVAAGFTPLQALQTATLNPARFYHHLADFGAVQPGRLADLLLLRANPLADIANTQQIAGVVADGRYLARPALDSLQAHLRQVAATR